MLSNVAFWGLKQFMGPYFQNLDDAALKISVLEGRVRLTNLSLNPDVLRNELDLPLSVTAGTVGLLSIELSWKNLFSRPIRVTLDELTLVIQPSHPKDFNEEKMKQAQLKRKRSEIESLEKEPTNAAEQDLFSSKSIFSIINNLQVVVKRIHLRYEDTGTITACDPFAAGVTLDQINMASADENWSPSVQELSQIVARKLLELKAFGIYLDSNLHTSDIISQQKLAATGIRSAMMDVFEDPHAMETHDCILQPLHFDGRLCCNKKVRAEDGSRPPQFEFDLDVPQLAIDVRRRQYLNVLRTITYISFVRKRREFGNYRPKQPVKGHARAWWEFAARCSTKRWKEQAEAWSWSRMKERRDQRQEYIDLFIKHLQKQASSADSKRIKHLEEKELSISDIRLYRKIARSRVPKRTSKGLFSTMKSWLTGGTTNEKEEDLEYQLQESHKELVQMLAREEDYEVSQDESYIGTMVRTALSRLVVRVFDDTNPKEFGHEVIKDEQNCLLFLECDKLAVAVDQRPAADGWAVKTSMSHIAAQAYSPGLGQLYDVIAPLPDPHISKDAAVALFFELNPLPVPGKPRLDMKVNLAMQGKLIQLQPKVAKRIIDFIDVPNDVNTTALLDSASVSFVQAHQQMRAGLEHAINTRKNFDITVDVRAPIITVCAPESTASSQYTLVVDLGTISMSSDIRSVRDTSQMSLQELQEYVYDVYNVKLSGLKAIFVDTMHDDWLAVHRTAAGPHHILDETSVSASIGRCLRNNDVRLPFIKLSGRLEDLRVGLSDEQVLELTRLALTSIDELELNKQKQQDDFRFASDFDAENYIYNQRVDNDLAAFLDASEQFSESDSEIHTPSNRSSKLPSRADSDDIFYDARSEAIDMEQPHSPAEIRLLEISFKVDLVHLDFYKAHGQDRVRHLGLTVYEVGAHLDVRKFDMVLDAQLGGMALMLHRPDISLAAHNKEQEGSYLIYTSDKPIAAAELPTNREVAWLASCEKTEQSFVKLKMHLADPVNPLLATQFDNTRLAVEVEVTRLAICADQAAVVVASQTTVPVVVKLVNTVLAMTEQQQGLTNTQQRQVAVVAGGAATRPDNLVDMALHVSITGLDFGLAHEGRYLTVLSLDDLVFGFSQAATKTTIKARLGAPRLVDYSIPDSIYPVIMDIVGEGTFIEAEVALCDNARDEEVPLTIILRTAPLRVFCLTAFVANIAEFIAPIHEAVARHVLPLIENEARERMERQEAIVLASPTSDAQPTSILLRQQQQKDAENKGKDGRLQLDVLIASPTVIVPFAPTSAEGIVLNFGSISATNNVTPCKQDPALSKDAHLVGRDSQTIILYNQMLVKISNLHASRAVIHPRETGANFLSSIRPLVVLGDSAVEVLLEANQFETYEEALKKAIDTDTDLLADTSLLKQANHGRRLQLTREAAQLMVVVSLSTTEIGLGHTDYLLLLQLVEQVQSSLLMRLQAPRRPDVLQPVAPPEMEPQEQSSPTMLLSESSSSNIAAPSADDSIVLSRQQPSSVRVTDKPRPHPSLRIAGAKAIEDRADLEEQLQTADKRVVESPEGEDQATEARRVQQDVPVSDVERLDTPRGMSMFFSVVWNELNASLYLEANADASTCRDDAHKITQLGVQGLVAEASIEGSGSNAVWASVSINNLHADDTCPPRKTRAQTGKDTFTILSTSATGNQPFLEGIFRSKRHTVRVVGNDDLDCTQLLDPLQEVGYLRSMYVQQNPPAGVQVAIGWMQDYKHAVRGVQALLDSDIAGVEVVDLGPPIDSEAKCIFRGFVTTLSPHYATNLLRFFLPEPLKRSKEKYETTPPLTSSERTIAAVEQATADSEALAPPPSTLRNPAYVRDILDDEPQARPLPHAYDYVKLLVDVEHPSVVLVEHLGANARQFNVDFVFKMQAVITSEVMFIDTHLSDFVIVSRKGDDPSTRLDCVAPFGLNAVFRQETGRTLVYTDVDPVNINLAYADVRTAYKIALTITEEYARLTAPHTLESWTQDPFSLTKQEHVPAPSPRGLDATLVTTSGVVMSEQLTVNVPCVNVLLINTTGGLRSPLLCVSTSLTLSAENWSRTIMAKATMQVAIAAIDPRFSSWEPFLLREAEEAEEPQPFSISLLVEGGDSGEIDLKTAGIERQTASKGYKSSDGLIAGSAVHLLDQNMQTYWCCAKTKKHSVTFDMRRCVKLQRFYYMPTTHPHRQPKESRLLTSESRNGPWLEVCRLNATQQHAQVAQVQSSKFIASGRYWRWEILSRFGRDGACVAYVGFQKYEGGMNFAVHTTDRMDLTVTSTSVQHITDVVTLWLNPDVGTSQQRPGSEERSGRVGTHKLLNLTGRALAFTPLPEFNVDVALKHVVQPNDSMVFTPEMYVQPADTEERSQHFMTHVKRRTTAITDIAIINVSKGERPPPGFKVIEKNLNEGGSGDVLHLCFASNPEKKPITDIQVSYVGMKGCITPKIGVHEPIPAGYDIIDTNLNKGASGARDIFMSVFRGNGAPIVDLTVIFFEGKCNESIPSDFYVLRKNLNCGQKRKENPFLCIKRAPCRWTGLEPKTITGEKPITDLYISIVKKGSSLLPQGRPENDPADEVLWDAFYDGRPWNINEKSGGDGVYLLRTTETRFDPITALKLDTKREPQDIGWETTGVNLNLGNRGDPLYLHYRREPGAPPVVEIRFFYGNHAPEGFIVLWPDLNKNVSLARACYMCYRVVDVHPAAVEVLDKDSPQLPIAVRSSPTDAELLEDDDVGCPQTPASDKYANISSSVRTQNSTAGSGMGNSLSSSQESAVNINPRMKALYAIELLRWSEKSKYAIGLEVDGYAPLMRVGISEVGETTYLLTSSSGSGRQVRLVVQVHNEKGVRHVIIRSPMFLENHMKHAIEICIPGYTNALEVMTVLEPHQQFSPDLGTLDLVSTDHMLVPLIRFYNPLEKKHIYTTNPLQAVRFSANMVQVSNLGYIYKYQLENTVPLWLTRLNASHAEYDCFVNRPGVMLPGTKTRKHELSEADLQRLDVRLAGYVYLDPIHADPHVVLEPMYRFHQPDLQDILMLTSAQELTSVRAAKKSGYKPLNCHHAEPSPMCYLVKNFGDVRVRRVGARHWSRMVDNPHMSLQPSQRELVCDQEARPFVCTLCPTWTSIGSSYYVREPIAFKNNLPVCVVFGICRGEDLPFSYVAVPPGGKTGFTSLLNERTFRVRVAVIKEMSLPEHETLDAEHPHGLTEEFWSKPCELNLDEGHKNKHRVTWIPPKQLSKTMTLLKFNFIVRREPEAYGPETAILYCPYQVINNTDLRLTLHPKTTSGEPFIPPVPQPKSEFDKRKQKTSSTDDDTHIVWLYSPLTRADETVISFEGFRTAPFDIAKLNTGNTLLKCYRMDEKGEIREKDKAPKVLLIHWQFADEDLLSKRFFIDPILTFKNETKETLYMAKVKTPTEDPLSQKAAQIPPGLTWHDADLPDKSLWKVAVSNVEGWSAAFSPTEMGIDVRVAHVLKIQNEEEDLTAVEADCLKTQERFVVTLKPVSKTPPLRVENFTGQVIAFRQAGVSWAPEYYLKSMQAMNYAMEDPSPAARKELEFRLVDEHNPDAAEWVTVPYCPSSLMALRHKQAAAVINVIPNRNTGVLQFIVANDAKQLRSLFGLPDVSPPEELLINLNVTLARGIAMSLVDSTSSRPTEFALLSFDNMRASFTQTTERMKISLAIHTLQLDFQQYDAIFPTILHGRNQTSDKQEERNAPIFEALFVQKFGDIGQSRAADSIEYFGAKLLPLEVRVDGVFVWRLLHFLDALALLPTDEIAGTPPPANPVALYCKQIFLSPIDVHFTVTNAQAAMQDLPIFFRTIGISIPNVNSAPFNLPCFELKDTLMSFTSLSIRLGEYYQHSVLRWLVSVGLISTILSMDMFGDPLQVVRDVAGGFKSLFYNPMASVLAGPEEFGAAVSKGVKDLGTGVVGGGLNMGAKMTSATGHGLAKATFDKDFQADRQREMRVAGTGARKGLFSGAKLFAKGLASGVTGLVMTPVREGREGGVGKGLVGVGKGVIGLLAKPASGTMDFVSCTLRGIESSISGRSNEVLRARLPRHIHVNGQVVPYSTTRAQGISFLQQHKQLREEFADIPYVAHVAEALVLDSSKSDRHLRVIFVLATRILVVSMVNQRKLSVDKVYDATKIVGFQHVEKLGGIELFFRDGGAAVLPVSDPKAYGALGKFLKMVMDLHINAAAEVKTPGTVFRPDSEHTSLVEVYEYERKVDEIWTKRFFPADPFAAYVLADDSKEQHHSLKEIQPSPNCHWVGPWILEHAESDEEGWLYTRTLDLVFSPEVRGATIRRRKWIREERSNATSHMSSDVHSHTSSYI
eukprot:m.239970 g.239970  ORF g.239970 m.239970 type:complete len:4319 (-) comp17127_c1_seq1:139-13095(-)